MEENTHLLPPLALFWKDTVKDVRRSLMFFRTKIIRACFYGTDFSHHTKRSHKAWKWRTTKQIHSEEK